MVESLESKFKRVQPDDPNRCQAVHADQQCPFRAVGDFVNGKWEGPQYCPRHGGGRNATQDNKNSIRMYQLAKWQVRINEMAEHPKIKSLGEEVGIIRMMLETKMNSLKDEKDLLMQASGIVNLTNSVRDLVRVWQHVEERSGQVLDRARMTLFVQELIRILETYIDNPDILQMIGEDINGSLEKLINQSNLSTK
jgi:hypothetical protein